MRPEPSTYSLGYVLLLLLLPWWMRLNPPSHIFASYVAILLSLPAITAAGAYHHSLPLPRLSRLPPHIPLAAAPSLFFLLLLLLLLRMLLPLLILLPPTTPATTTITLLQITPPIPTAAKRTASTRAAATPAVITASKHGKNL